ncbi:hypothetical protein WME95_38750 [Sorangium sp. So ce327]|uniref:hypothetical protein n=1 Tax=Sorangium sp. So ce327 TaxID=3133301 RepID=UPI003F63B10C
MRHISLVGIALVVPLFIGCSSHVDLDADSASASGSGGAPSGGGGAPSGEGGAPSGETMVSPGCPSEVLVESTACPEIGKTCTYTTGDCVLVFECKPNEGDPDDIYNSCAARPAAWLKTEQSACGGCSGANASCAPCEGASPGEPCDAVGYACEDDFGGGNCGGAMRCKQDKTWAASTLYPWCCI